MSQILKAFVGLCCLLLSACNDDALPPDHLRIVGADPERGRALTYSFGCGTCHTIEGVPGARGTVASALDDYAARSVLAGIVPNTPQALIAWLLDPASIDPRTGMPVVGLSEEEARDIAAFLYTLGAAKAEIYPAAPQLDLQQPAQPSPQDLRQAVKRSG